MSQRRRSELAALAISGLLLAVVAAPARAQQTPVGWEKVADFLIQDVCLSPSGSVLTGVSPIDGPDACPRRRDLNVGERLPYHKHDWADLESRSQLPHGLQRGDSFPVDVANRVAAVVQVWDFGPPLGRFGRFDPSAGDGGQVAFFSDRTVAYGLTQDGDGLQFFYGPACDAPDALRRLADSWVIVAQDFTPDRPGQTLARVTKWPDRCPARLGYAFTRWQTRPQTYRLHSATGDKREPLLTLISDHFGGRTPQRANHLERFYFTRELGYVRWERWENLARPGDPVLRHDVEARAEALARAATCERIEEPPASTGQWAMIGCRQWTNLVGPDDPAGDSPDFWIQRLRSEPTTDGLFAK